MSLETVSWAGTAVISTFVGVGAFSQQITGFGFAIVSAPIFSLVLGAHDGVRFVNMLGVAISGVSLAAWWRNVAWPDVARLLIPALVITPPAAYVVHRLNADVLLLAAGALVLMAAAALAFGLQIRRLRGNAGAVIAGMTSATMNLIGGVSGPTVAMFASNADWEHRKFRATVQAYFLVLNLASVIALGPAQPKGSTWAAVVSALTLGVILGRLMARHIAAEVVRSLTLAMAAFAGLAAVLRGLFYF